jgi:hypothetical protein
VSTAETSVEAILRDRVAAAHVRRTAELRHAADEAARRLADRLTVAATLRLVLEGAGGGEWYLVVRDGEMRVETASDDVPVMTVFQSVADWRRLLAADKGLFAAGGGGTDLSPARVARLQALSGALEFRLTEVDGGEPVSVQLQLGAARERLAPATTITLRAEDAQRMRTGELAPPQAMMQGLVQLAGDMSLAMQVGAALFM